MYVLRRRRRRNLIFTQRTMVPWPLRPLARRERRTGLKILGDGKKIRHGRFVFNKKKKGKIEFTARIQILYRIPSDSDLSDENNKTFVLRIIIFKFLFFSLINTLRYDFVKNPHVIFKAFIFSDHDHCLYRNIIEIKYAFFGVFVLKLLYY